MNDASWSEPAAIGAGPTAPVLASQGQQELDLMMSSYLKQLLIATHTDARFATEGFDKDASQKHDDRATDPIRTINDHLNATHSLSHPNLKGIREPRMRSDGSARDDFSVYLERAGMVLSFVIPAVGNVLKGAGAADQDQKASVSEVLRGGVNGYLNHLRNLEKGAVNTIKSGRLTPFNLAFNLIQESVKDNLKDIARYAEE
ncbi:hypothetical protein [Variovorax sp. 770b2]|uniref:hypothetical protein n=1 Tax=Variovorax sp. 770b2 TaxID=1566271 RepID=UPI00116056F9|nr:hypothetical protein [Variovorax sp. 770b2]